MNIINRLKTLTLFRFLLIGGFTAVLYYSCIFFFDYFIGLGYFWAITLAYVISTVFHFAANKYFTFNSSSNINLSQIFRYLVIWLLNYSITLVVVKSSLYFYCLSPYIGVFLSLFITTAVGFFASRHWVFNEKGYAI